MRIRLGIERLDCRIMPDGTQQNGEPPIEDPPPSPPPPVYVSFLDEYVDYETYISDLAFYDESQNPTLNVSVTSTDYTISELQTAFVNNSTISITGSLSGIISGATAATAALILQHLQDLVALFNSGIPIWESTAMEHELIAGPFEFWDQMRSDLQEEYRIEASKENPNPLVLVQLTNNIRIARNNANALRNELLETYSRFADIEAKMVSTRNAILELQQVYITLTGVSSGIVTPEMARRPDFGSSLLLPPTPIVWGDYLEESP